MLPDKLISEFRAYQKRIAGRSDMTSYYFDLPNSPFIIQYHNDGKELFGAVFDKCKNFQYYIPKVELN